MMGATPKEESNRQTTLNSLQVLFSATMSVFELSLFSATTLIRCLLCLSRTYLLAFSKLTRTVPCPLAPSEDFLDPSVRVLQAMTCSSMAHTGRQPADRT